MSASPIARQVTQNQNIPLTKRVVIEDANQLPADYSSTPGGTLYSTTPGGTRIVYDRAFLMTLRNSPISRTPPSNLTNMPADIQKNQPTGVTAPVQTSNGPASTIKVSPTKNTAKEIPVIDETSEQFQMDM
ncbi:eukaryotic translation initiation factor 4E-binding protein [Leptopilina boulardi]|uniref:eukaryotic translation initiation factor 4E-binding protein n=1 Tax=Leptopilina boulardi TaxID=63433 RepID=UPI0021F5BE03|nr:eukaryotic translation initiation factor 4E-binding protein [Leptopilina boulardi]